LSASVLLPLAESPVERAAGPAAEHERCARMRQAQAEWNETDLKLNERNQPALSSRGASVAVLAYKPTVRAAAPAESPLLLTEEDASADFSRLREPPSSGTAAADDGVAAANADARTLADGVLARSSLLPAMRERLAPGSSGRKSMASSARDSCSSAKGAERGRPLRVSSTPRLVGSTGGRCTSRRLPESTSDVMSGWNGRWRWV
jgi:hypothetical protein